MSSSTSKPSRETLAELHVLTRRLLAQARRIGDGQISGGGEANLTPQVKQLLEGYASHRLHGRNKKTRVDEQVLRADGRLRLDLVVQADGQTIGDVEVKRPDLSLEKSRDNTEHNRRQWQQLKDFPNLIYTSGWEWELWRYGEQAGQLTLDDTPAAVEKLGLLLEDFLLWEPQPITSYTGLLHRLPALTRMLRDEVLTVLGEAQQAEKQQEEATRGLLSAGTGISDEYRQLLGLLDSWRAALFPGLGDKEFADGFAQTVVFSLLLGLM